MDSNYVEEQEHDSKYFLLFTLKPGRLVSILFSLFTLFYERGSGGVTLSRADSDTLGTGAGLTVSESPVTTE